MSMEYEKMNIMNENLKQKLENQISDNRDLEKKLRQREKELQECDKKIEVSEARIEGLNEKMLDLRLQVREEAIKNTKLDQEIEALTDIKKQLVEKNEEIEKLKTELEETKILLVHAKKSWKDEREKVKQYEEAEREEKSKEEEMELTKSENITLKKLVIAKDTVLVQKSQILENLKNVINKHEQEEINVERIRKILQKKPSFATGNKAKHGVLMNGEVEPVVNGWLDETIQPQNGKKQPSQQRGNLLHSLLFDEKHKYQHHPQQVGYPLVPSASCDSRMAPRHTKTTPGKHNNYQTSSFTNFRTPTQSLESIDTTKHFANIKSRWHTNKDPHTNKTDSTSKSDSKSSHTAKGMSESNKLKRSKSTENRISLPDQHNKLETFRPASPSTWSHKATSVSTVGSTGSGSISAVMLKAAPEMDRKYSRIVRNGDRVVVDMAKSKDKRKNNYQSGVIKFIGNLDKEHDCYRIYIGVRLDDPVGDTDGMYKGRRYFKVTAGHGKFVRITRVVNVYNKETSKFDQAVDLLKQLGLEVTHDQQEEEDKRFELDI